MQDGSEDLEQPSGSWPMQSIQMANSLKMRGYDFHFTLGSGTHNRAEQLRNARGTSLALAELRSAKDR